MNQAAIPTRRLDRRGATESLERELRQLLGQLARYRPERIRRMSKLREELGIDSFTGIEILVAIERRYGVQISEAEAAAIRTFGVLVQTLARKLNGRE